jgi:hypothetical protein
MLIKTNQSTVILIILVLTWFWFIFFNFIKRDSLLMLINQQPFNQTPLSQNALLPDNKVSSDFVSKYNNLGIIAIRFNTFSRINNDTLTFRLKEKGQSDWYYQNNYKTDQFQDQELFPFGFPIISDSKNKTYIFEIQSQHGKADDAVAISQIQPNLVSKNKIFPRELITEPTLFIQNLYLHFLFEFTNNKIIYRLICYSPPLIFYLFYLLINRQFPHRSKKG